jgi:predicted acylesterase/phospholipase RssA
MKSIIIASLTAIASAASDKCYGLALSSGKNVGPYQAGALQALLENGSWDAISGVTEGALNAYILSLYKDEPLAASDHLHKFWTYLGSTDVYE